MRAGQSSVIAFFISHDREVESLESIDRGPIATSRELQELSSLLIVPLIDDDLPEPDYHTMLLVEAIAIHRGLLELCKVKRLLTTQQRRQLCKIKELSQKGGTDEATEAFPEGI